MTSEQMVVRRTRARARPWLQARPRPQSQGAARDPAGARETRPRPHRGADPGSADLVGASASWSDAEAGCAASSDWARRSCAPTVKLAALEPLQAPWASGACQCENSRIS